MQRSRKLLSLLSLYVDIELTGSESGALVRFKDVYVNH